ncbi:hypothetical protein CK203_094967 [Vitis vinifera]|uniref:Retrotransposon gag domain-containing protein n=1 Tax=Vitis vinifera TaxID=29760 RepID=A0A438DQI2_VITVI|nr:hypothetical protein CK203_094967 [Vitis vinifera]
MMKQTWHLMSLISGYSLLDCTLRVPGVFTWNIDMIDRIDLFWLRISSRRLGVGSSDGAISMHGSILEESDTHVRRSPIIEDLKPPGMRGSACVEVMTTLHGSAPSLRGVQRVAYRRRLRVLGDRYEFEYWLDHLSSCHLSLCFSLDEFSMFSPMAFVLISWLDTPLHFVVTHSMLWDMFMIIFLHCTPITGSVPHHLFDPWFDFRLDAHIFITERCQLHRRCLLFHMIMLPSFPPMVTPVTVIEDPHSRMDRLEQRIRRMRDLDEMISWDDPGDVPSGHFASTVAHFVPIVIERHDTEMVRFIRVISSENLGDLAQEFLRQYSFSGDTSVTRRELEFLRQGSDESVSSFISRWREKAAEMIERPTERDQMSMFLRSLHPRFARHLTGVPFQDFRSLVQALFDVDDGISRGLWSDIIPSQILREELVDHLRAMETYVLRTFSIDDLVIILCEIIADTQDFSVHRLVSHGMSSLVPIGDVRGLILIWGCLWIELLSDSDLLMAGHRTDYCASLRHTIQDLIDSGAVSFPISTTDTDLGPDMTTDSFPVYSTRAVPPPSGLYHHILDTQGTDIHRTL